MKACGACFQFFFFFILFEFSGLEDLTRWVRQVMVECNNINTRMGGRSPENVDFRKNRVVFCSEFRPPIVFQAGGT